MSKGNDQGMSTKIRKLLDVAREKHYELGECLAEIEKLLEGGMSIGEKLKALEFAFESCWRARYHSDYLWNYNEDRGHWKRLLKKLDIEELELRMARYLADEDPFYVQHHHIFRYFNSNINTWAEQPALGTRQNVPNCSHQPPCQDDAAHTRRREEELRIES